jgi:biotin carboxylase
MKPYYKKAGVKVARYCLATSVRTCKNFIEKVGYPVIVKPDNGVGANDTHKINNEEQLKTFFKNKLPLTYIMEEFIDAEVNSYDAVIDSHGNPIFETGNVTPKSLMDVVNNEDNSMFYIVNKPFDDVRAAGRKVVKAFGVKSRFVHFEFFRLNCDQHIGKKGEVVALEVNMRPSGGISPEMFNYANSTDVYKIWADMIAYDSTLVNTGEKYFCAFAGRRQHKEYAFSEQDIIDKYRANLKSVGRVPKALSGAMGDYMFLANFKTREEMNEFYLEVTKTV